MAVEQAVKSRQLLSIDMEVYINDKRQKAVLVITDHVLITLYKSAGNQPVISPVKVNDIETLCLAESMPSAAALQFKQEVEAKIGRSALIFESPNLGLLMRYLLEKDYQTSIEFANQIDYKIGGFSETYFFSNMQELRDAERDNFTNGVLRSTYKTVIYELEQRMFKTNLWHSKIAVVSNIGIFIFTQEDIKKKP